MTFPNDVNDFLTLAQVVCKHIYLFNEVVTSKFRLDAL
jgi:hypothetical protein